MPRREAAAVSEATNKNIREDQMSNALAIIQGDIYNAKDGFAAVQTDRSISFEKEAGFALQILGGNEYLMGVGLKNRQSVVDAVTNIAAIGISLNPARKQAYLVPRDGKVCLDISYMGLLDLAISSGSLKWGQAELVRESDAFVLNGFDKPPTHSFNPFDKNRGEVIGAYVVVKTADGDFLTTAMSIDEINAIRDRSESWKRGQKGPWKSDPGEMAKKTVIKRASKLWPKTARLDQAIHYLNTDGDEGLGFNQSAQAPEQAVDVVPMIAAAIKTKTDAEALQYWKDNNAKLAKQPQDHARLKQAIVEHRAKLKQAEDARTVEMPAAAPAPEYTPE
jgi:recombination protein RecT